MSIPYLIAMETLSPISRTSEVGHFLTYVSYLTHESIQHLGFYLSVWKNLKNALKFKMMKCWCINWLPSWESRAEKVLIRHCRIAQISLRSSLAPRKMFKDLFGNTKESSSLRAIMRHSIDGKCSMVEGELCAICSRDGQQNECGLQGSEDLAWTPYLWLWCPGIGCNLTTPQFSYL